MYARRRANRVYTLDLPGHGADADGDTGDVGLEECVHSIKRTVEREGLKDLVLVGHGSFGSLLLQAASELPQPSKRVVLVAGILPAAQRSIISALPQRARTAFWILSTVSRLFGRDLKFPQSVIRGHLCNGMDPMEVVRFLGFFGAVATRVLTTKVDLDDVTLTCPLTYVVLTQDKVLPVELQERMAVRVPGAELVFIDSCHQVTLDKPKELADVLLAYA